jgi:nucleoside-diphosphate-sugar epimerase
MAVAQSDPRGRQLRVFLAGATGAIGRRLVPMLLADGHEVIGMTRTPAKTDALRAAGVEPVVADALDESAVLRVVAEARPDAVIHELTSIPQKANPRRIESEFLMNDRLRSEGTRFLLAAARAAGARKVIAQSIAFAYAPGPPGTLHDEQDPMLADEAHASFRRTALAVGDLESFVLSASGIVLRYGYFYGPGTWIAPAGSVVADLRRRRFPVVGKGSGVWSFVHIDDAARATVRALSQEGPGVYNIVDDEPALVRDWIPALARAVGAPKPISVPVWLARLVGGPYAVSLMTGTQGAENRRAKQDLGWQPEHPSWREGFRSALS